MTKLWPSALSLLVLMVMADNWVLYIEASNIIPYPYTQEWKDRMVVVHNMIRRAVFPTAARMDYVIWDKDLEKIAYDHVNLCVFEHTNKASGNNIYMGYKETPIPLMMAFLKERKDFSYANSSCLNNKMCGHYRQLAVYPMRKFACALQIKCRNNFMICVYDRGHRVHPYEEGEPCSACKPPYEYCSDGLCISKELSVKLKVQAECKLECQNCGSSTSRLLPGSCKCLCKDYSTGWLCQEMKTSSSSCPVCNRPGFVCKNGGTIAGATEKKCHCRCEIGFTGPRCQFNSRELSSSVMFSVRGERDNGMYFPINRWLFKREMFPKISSHLAATINSFCKSPENYKLCCPLAIQPPTSDIITPSGVRIATGFPRITRNFKLRVALSAELHRPRFCPGFERLPPKALVKIVEPVLKRFAASDRVFDSSFVDIRPGRPDYDVKTEHNKF